MPELEMRHKSLSTQYSKVKNRVKFAPLPPSKPVPVFSSAYQSALWGLRGWQWWPRVYKKEEEKKEEGKRRALGSSLDPLSFSWDLDLGC